MPILICLTSKSKNLLQGEPSPYECLETVDKIFEFLPIPEIDQKGCKLLVDSSDFLIYSANAPILLEGVFFLSKGMLVLQRFIEAEGENIVPLEPITS